jgi:hypothetical protein
LNQTRSAYLDWLASVLNPPSSPPSRQEWGEPRDLVLGYATGYGVADIAPFVRSLRAVFEGDVALVVDPHADLLQFLHDHRIEAVTPEFGLRPWSPHPVVERFAAYTTYLQSRADVGDVVLTDVRDVVFQGDPLAEPVTTLEFFEENEGRSLRSHAFNLKHLRALAGPALAKSLQDRSCVCVGVVVGPREAALRFCRALLMLCAIPRSGVGGAFGADQAACNLIAHLGLVEGVVRPNFGRVATIGLTASERLRVEDERIIGPEESVSPIVHQYDRKKDLQAFVQSRWGVPHRPSSARSAFKRRSEVLTASVRRRLPELR